MVSDDLNKLMSKLKKKDPEEDVEEEDLGDEDEELDEDSEEDEEETEAKEVKNVGKPTEDKSNQEEVINSEVGILQNNGIFRRELLLVLKELVDVHKVNTKVLIDFKKKFDEEDGTAKKE